MPAAVVSIGKNRVDSEAATSTALYPATLACDDSASITCAREIRGIASNANACTPAFFSASIWLSALRGAKKPISVWPAAQLSDLLGRRRRDLDHHIGRPCVADRRARLGIQLVGQQRRLTRAGLHHHGHPAVDQRGHRLRHQRHPPLVGAGLADHPDRRLRSVSCICHPPPCPCEYCERHLNRYR